MWRKPVHVVFTYLSRNLLVEIGGDGLASNASTPHHHLISQLIRGYLFKNDDAVIIFLGVNTLEPLGIRQVMTSMSHAYILL